MSADPPGLPSSVWAALLAQPDDAPLVGDVTAARMRTRVARLGEQLTDRGVAGQVVGLQLENGPDWVLWFLTLLRADAHPLLLSPTSPAEEVAGTLARAGAGLWVSCSGTSVELRGHSTGSTRPGPGEVLLSTSGSTGRPILVRRSQRSLLLEGWRYAAGVGVRHDDVVLLPLPLGHAYALGWLAATVLVGARVLPMPPAALDAVGLSLAEATVLAVVPDTARLLTRRWTARGSVPQAPRLRLAMAGAGPVDPALDAGFAGAVGVGLARNYGSTETGALFSGLPHLPALCVGTALPGVEYRLVADFPDEPDPVGLLEVRLHGGERWHALGDLARVDAEGRLSILGRRAGAIRRGDRWVIPGEIEAVLRQSPDLADARVSCGLREGRPRVIAEVVPRGPQRFDAARVVADARARLAPEKVPDDVIVRRCLRRTALGKLAAPPRYRAAAPGLLAQGARAYKVSETLFALRDLGVLERLDGTRSAVDLALELDLQVGELGALLDIAAGMGLVTREGDDDDGCPALPLVELEEALSRTWVTRRGIAEAVRTGVGRRRFDVEVPSAALVDLYQRAMHGEGAHRRSQLVARMCALRPTDRVLEVSGGPGRFLAAARGRLAAESRLLRVGSLTGETPGCPYPSIDASRAAPGRWEVCVVTNAIHGPYPGDDLHWLLERLAPGGRLLIDDVFLPDGGGPGSELGVDWLTHGSLSWPTIVELGYGLRAADARVARHVPVGPLNHLLLIEKEEGHGGHPGTAEGDDRQGVGPRDRAFLDRGRRPDRRAAAGLDRHAGDPHLGRE